VFRFHDWSSRLWVVRLRTIAAPQLDRKPLRRTTVRPAHHFPVRRGWPDRSSIPPLPNCGTSNPELLLARSPGPRKRCGGPATAAAQILPNLNAGANTTSTAASCSTPAVSSERSTAIRVRRPRRRGRRSWTVNVPASLRHKNPVLSARVSCRAPARHRDRRHVRRRRATTCCSASLPRLPRLQRPMAAD